MPIIMEAELESRAWLMRDSLWFISSRDLIGVKFNGHCRLPPPHSAQITGSLTRFHNWVKFHGVE